MLNTDLLLKYGGEEKEIKKNEIIFSENNTATHFFQVVKGQVKLNNYFYNGKEFIQNIIKDNQSFGEAMLFTEHPYPYNAIAMTSTELIQIHKESLKKLLFQDKESTTTLIKTLADELYYKAILAPEISCQDAERRILFFLEYEKKASTSCTKQQYEISLTRQLLGDLTGLRVETVIRTLKILEKKGYIKILNGKIYI